MDTTLISGPIPLQWDLGESYVEQNAFKTADCLNCLEQVDSLAAV